MNKRTLSVGGATYDLFLTMQAGLEAKDHAIQLQIGHKLEVESVTETCGGGACNTSVGLARLGCSASFCGILGSDQWGEKLLETLKKEGVDTSSVTIVENETSSFSIILSLPGGERTILYTAGVNEHLHDATFDKGAIDTADGMYINHLCDAADMIQDDLVETIAKHPRLIVAWNPGGGQIGSGMQDTETKKLLKLTTVLFLNKEEALKFTKTQTVTEAMRSLIAAGVKNVCITDGKNGTDASDGKNFYHCPILPDVKVVDTTGAGDAFGTGVFWSLLQGHPLQKSLISGTLNAASVVSSLGAQKGLLTAKQMSDLLRFCPLVPSVYV